MFFAKFKILITLNFNFHRSVSNSSYSNSHNMGRLCKEGGGDFPERDVGSREGGKNFLQRSHCWEPQNVRPAPLHGKGLETTVLERG